VHNKNWVKGKELRCSVQSSKLIVVDRFVLAHPCNMNNQDALFSVNLLQFQQPVNITHDYNSYCSHRVGPPDDEQQGCWKHVGVYY
jgi:hypothetical protein